MFTPANTKPQVFVSYIRENSEVVERLVLDLEREGFDVWYDRKALYAGVYWKDEIRAAIQRGDYFVACFSREFQVRERGYMGEELTLAIDEIRVRFNQSWFVPVLLSGVIPPITIGNGRTLADIHYVDFANTKWEVAVAALARAIRIDFGLKLANRDKLLRETLPVHELGRTYDLRDGIFEMPADYAFEFKYSNRQSRSSDLAEALGAYRRKVYAHLRRAALSPRERALLEHLSHGPLLRPPSVSIFYASVEDCVEAAWSELDGRSDVPNVRPLIRECVDQDGDWQLRLWTAAKEPVQAFLEKRELQPDA